MPNHGFSLTDITGQLVITPLPYHQDTTEEKIEKFLYNGDDRNILQVYVAGRNVMDKTR